MVQPELFGPDDWRFWYIRFQWFAVTLNLWEEANPDGPDLPSIHLQKPRILKLPANRGEAISTSFDFSTKLYKIQKELWDDKYARYERLSKWVYSTVSLHLQVEIMTKLLSKVEDCTLQAFVRALRSFL